jgi:hypothetical protein
MSEIGFERDLTGLGKKNSGLELNAVHHGQVHHTDLWMETNGPGLVDTCLITLLAAKQHGSFAHTDRTV